MNTQDQMMYVCQCGVPGSAVRLNGEPTADQWTQLAKLGFERATLGERFRRDVACPVNGDGYWYTRVELRDSEGHVVGSAEVPDGPGGEL